MENQLKRIEANELENLLEEFADYLQTLNYAAHTINSYTKDLKEYIKFLEDNNIDFNDATHYTIRDYFASLKNKN